MRTTTQGTGEERRGLPRHKGPKPRDKSTTIAEGKKIGFGRELGTMMTLNYADMRLSVFSKNKLIFGAAIGSLCLLKCQILHLMGEF